MSEQEVQKQGFWSWLWDNIKQTPNVLKDPVSEWGYALVVLIGGVILAKAVGYWLLAITIPVGFLILSHGIWRNED